MILVPKVSIHLSLMIKINSKMATYKKASFYHTVIHSSQVHKHCYSSLCICYVYWETSLLLAFLFVKNLCGFVLIYLISDSYFYSSQQPQYLTSRRYLRHKLGFCFLALSGLRCSIQNQLLQCMGLLVAVHMAAAGAAHGSSAVAYGLQSTQAQGLQLMGLAPPQHVGS